MACGVDDFYKKVQVLEKKISFYFNKFNFLTYLLLQKTLKGSRNIQGFALIRAVLLLFRNSLAKSSHFIGNYVQSSHRTITTLWLVDVQI